MLLFISMIKFSSKMFSSFSGVCCYGKYFLKLTENNQKRQRMLFALEKRKSLSAIPLCSHPPFLCATSTATTLTSTLPPPNHHCPHSHTSFTAAITNPLSLPPPTISTTTVPTGNINERSLRDHCKVVTKLKKTSLVIPRLF